MSAWLPALLVVLGLALVVLTWRAAAWPCPPWLVPLLENPYVRAVAGAELILDRAGPRPGQHLLDAGCGPGRVTLPAARRVGPRGRVTALDLQPVMLERLRRRLGRAGLENVDLVLGGLGEGRLPRETFDVALLVTVLGEVRDQPAALRELHDALRPGGLLSITELLPDPHYQRLAHVRRRVAAAGFEEVALHGRRLAYTLNVRKPRTHGTGAR